jgi:hypothetical protein
MRNRIDASRTAILTPEEAHARIDSLVTYDDILRIEAWRGVSPEQLSAAQNRRLELARYLFRLNQAVPELSATEMLDQRRSSLAEPLVGDIVF